MICTVISRKEEPNGDIVASLRVGEQTLFSQRYSNEVIGVHNLRPGNTVDIVPGALGTRISLIAASVKPCSPVWN